MEMRKKFNKRMIGMLEKASDEALDNLSSKYFIADHPTIHEIGRDLLVKKIVEFRYFCYINKFKYPKRIKTHKNE